ncbi:Podoplanin [Myotis brandtii]|uniref:Podoplanin n=1 Tax=Myotis brandtii TaxID=109478 RepID=S7N7V8_MYOBR|nr:Podoplanin [Myotis brandtii]
MLPSALGADSEGLPHPEPKENCPVPTNTKRTDTPIEDLPTTESTGHAQEETQSTTALNGATSHPRDGFSTGTLIGIIVGVLLGIGFIAGIIIVVVRKMSGRYSPRLQMKTSGGHSAVKEGLLELSLKNERNCPGRGSRGGSP